MESEFSSFHPSSLIPHPSSLQGIPHPFKEPRLRELLDELMDSELTPEEVCRQCPELLPVVRERWLQQRACDAQLDALFPAPEIAAPLVTSALPADLPQIPGYIVQEVLGHGGMGVVYKALHVRLNRTVALKMLLTGADQSPEYRARFLQEAEAVAALRHPNIVHVYDMGDLNGRPYFTMEFVEGGNLAQKAPGLPQPARAAALVATLAEAVEAAHQKGIVHRDLKPTNVLLTADGTPKVSDFGLARRLDAAAGLTRTGIPVGTPSYMAPEQAEARSLTIGPAVDIHALGAILYELLTGRPPFQAETAAETVRLVISVEPMPPSRRNGKVPRDLETICLKCLHKEPHHRYPSAAALAADLHRFLRGEAILARPDRLVTWLLRRSRRRLAQSPALVVGTLVTVALVSGGFWLMSDRAAVKRKVETERVATERGAAEDLEEMARCLKKSSWSEARAALERARGRLGAHGSVELRRRLDQGARDLELVARLDAIRMEIARGVLGFDFARTDEQYREAFRTSGIGQIHDDPDSVADRVRASNIHRVLVAALDDWCGCTRDPRTRTWVLAVARKAEPDPTSWRDRARKSMIHADQASILEALQNVPVDDPCVPLVLALDRQLNPDNKERLPFLMRFQQAHPDDFWLNETLGDVLLWQNKPAEAIRYYQAALAIRPWTALSHHLLGYALFVTGNKEESLRHVRLAIDLVPTSSVSQQLLAVILTSLGQYDAAIDRLKMAILLTPDAANLHNELGRNLEIQGRADEALAQHRQAVALDPKNTGYQMELRNLLTRLGRDEEARIDWLKALDAQPPQAADWDNYAAFCLFIGQENEYRRVRRILLNVGDPSSDPIMIKRIACLCLLLPATDHELQQAVALADRAVATDPSFLFVKALAEYRQGDFARALWTLRGDASQALDLAPRLVRAMVLHRSGQVEEARKALAAAMLAHDWRAFQVRDGNDWALHVLRREAEHLILPNLPAFLQGRYQPQDAAERLAMLGECQFTNRVHAMARLYADTFATTPQLVHDVGTTHRISAARAAALVGTGRSEDGETLSIEERKRWQNQAHAWLALELAAMSGTLNHADSTNRHLVWATLTFWRTDPALTGLREAGALNQLSPEERNAWRTLWKEVDDLLNRATGP